MCFIFFEWVIQIFLWQYLKASDSIKEPSTKKSFKLDISFSVTLYKIWLEKFPAQNLLTKDTEKLWHASLLSGLSKLLKSSLSPFGYKCSVFDELTLFFQVYNTFLKFFTENELAPPCFCVPIHLLLFCFVCVLNRLSTTTMYWELDMIVKTFSLIFTTTRKSNILHVPQLKWWWLKVTQPETVNWSVKIGLPEFLTVPLCQ